jgi:O-antigen/teichoic acid export membrane protein
VVAVAVATFISGVGDAGIGTVVTRQLAAGGDDNLGPYVRLVKRWLPIVLLGSALTVVAFSLALESESPTWLVLMLGFGAALELGATFTLSVHRGQGQLRQEGLVRAMEAAVFVAGGAFAQLVVDGDQKAMASVYVVGGLVFFAGAWIQFVVDHGRITSVSVDKVSFSRAATLGLPILLANVIFFLYLRIDAVLLSLLGGSEAAGLYGAAYNFVFGAIFIPYTLSRGLVPKFASTATSSLRSTHTHYALIFAVFLCGYALFLLMAKPALGIVYGREFEGASGPYLLLIAAYVLVGFTTLNNSLLVARGRAHAALGALAAGLAANVSANLSLIPQFGPSGAAAALIISESVVLLVQLLAARQILRVAASASTRVREPQEIAAA